jgi:signal transduction histidine kinase/PAS domain-containing protein
VPLVEQVEIAAVVQALLQDFSAIIDYKTLQDSLPRRLATLLRCRCVLFYQRIGETLQFVAGSFDDQPGWSSALLSVARINPIPLTGDLLEAQAWRERHARATPSRAPTHIAAPLIYRQRCIGVMVAIRLPREECSEPPMAWQADEVSMVEAVAGVVALLLENTRLLERDRERIHELSLLNSISSQMHYSMYEYERMRAVIVQRAREISMADLGALLEVPARGARTRPRPPEKETWVTEELLTLLLHYFGEQKFPEILLLELPGAINDPWSQQVAQALPSSVKTFFAVPLLGGKIGARRGGSLLRGSISKDQEYAQETSILGVVIGAYHAPWKLRKSELVLLQVLASQAGAALENMTLMHEVLEARNEARKLLRQVLEDQRLKEMILESIPSGLITTDRSGRVTTFNRAAAAILGYHAREIVGQPLARVLDIRALHVAPAPYEQYFSPIEQPSSSPGLDEPASETQTFEAVLSALRGEASGEGARLNGTSARADGEPGSTGPLQRLPAPIHALLGELRSGTIKNTDRQGREVVLEVDALPLSDESNMPIGMLVTFTDVTSVHRLEEEKRRLDRLATLGEMAANVAHEVRNPLASIKTSMQMIMEELSTTTEPLPSDEIDCGLGSDQAWIREESSVVLKEVERLNAIVHDLLLFAKPRQLHRAPCSLSELSDRVLHFIQPQCEAANVVVHRVYHDIPAVGVDAGQMEQVLLNLYMNALQAMSEGGILTVSCMTLPAEQEMAEDEQEDVATTRSPQALVGLQRPGITLSQWVEIAVSDTGEGIRPEQLGRIFQPFFTTKAHGIGLGLAITRRLVEDHGGYIRVEGHYGYGATISIRLPVFDENVCTSSRRKGAYEVPRGNMLLEEEMLVEEGVDEPGYSDRR